MPDDPRASLVAEGYDAIVDRYLDWAARIRDDPRRAWLARFARRLPAGGSVLDLGCGAGTTLAALAERFDATGVDISPAQAARARQLVPRARVLVGDMTTIELPPAAFDGVCALYSITHVARDRHAALFARIARWIRPGGRFLAALGARDDPGWTGTWLGVPMFFSSFDAETNRALLDDAGLRIVSHRTYGLREPNDDGTFSDAAFLWVLARRA